MNPGPWRLKYASRCIICWATPGSDPPRPHLANCWGSSYRVRSRREHSSRQTRWNWFAGVGFTRQTTNSGDRRRCISSEHDLSSSWLSGWQATPSAGKPRANEGMACTKANIRVKPSSHFRHRQIPPRPRAMQGARIGAAKHWRAACSLHRRARWAPLPGGSRRSEGAPWPP